MNLSQNSNLSNAERLRFMPEEVLRAYPFIEQWADTDAKMVQLENISIHINEAKNYPDEDFLENIMDMVRDLMPQSGQKVAAFKDLLEALELKQSETTSASDYAREELAKADTILAHLLIG